MPTASTIPLSSSSSSQKEPSKTDNESDVELEGMELGGIEDAEDEPEESPSEEENDGKKDNDEEDTLLAKEEEDEMEEARKERMELMDLEKKKMAKQHKEEEDAHHRLEYLCAQSEVFAHFLAGSVAASGKTPANKTGSRGKKGRMTEAEEDAQLLKSAQSKRRTVRLDKQPSNLSPICKMHAYQLEGLNWLIKLHDHGINGILADEMGLGKTLQTISLLAYLRESRGVRGPHIIIVPKSVVGNWMREIKKWCPCIKACKMGGTKAERHKFIHEDLPLDPATKKRRFDVLVTSYEGILRERGPLAKVSWKYLIIDEAHRIKNEHSSLSKVVRMMETQFRVLITGTPLQNNLHELWALLNFLMPDIFGDAAQFDEWFSLSGEQGQHNVIRKLHTVLRPFMLRRVKKDVACGLPPKKETKLYIGLTDMQQEWYMRVLRKDAHELNSLGGPDRVRLLNVLMQLRKVCNHPYLFDGAEKGPPYSDGPHLWENSGKMLLLHKLLPKLKKNGSRVLIFTQMTRILDIMEDYLRLIGYEYCRIDGTTEGEKRDSQMDDFNAPGSSKFAFLLSTRAGGLGINLATADIVILFDSDWNPQVDLQAMDRAHRIGQTKPVQVFRFVTEGTVEEKIIEKADRKLFLDAAVIQQGRLAEKHSSVDKKDLMTMVRFGADQIISGKGGTYTDEDIDALIAKGEEKTNAMQAKLETDAQHNLANFSLLGENESEVDTFSFGGVNYREEKKGQGNFINLPQRERKRNYDVNEYFRETMQTGNIKAHAADAAAKKRKKGPHVQDFQLYDKERLDLFVYRERELAMRKETQLELIKQYRQRAQHAPSRQSRSDVGPGQSREDILKQAEEMERKLDEFNLTAEEQAEKEYLLAEGFPDWSKKDFKAFCSSLERHGRYNLPSIVNDVVTECAKDENEVKRYFVAFWTNYRRLSDWKKVIERIERGERKTLRLREIRDAITEKVERFLENMYHQFYPDAINGVKEDGTNSTDQSSSCQKAEEIPSPEELLNYTWPRMKFNYGPGLKGRCYGEEEDAFLLCMMHRHGYGAAERIRMEIRRAWQFRFDWFFKSRNAAELQKRCDVIIKLIEKENDELRRKEEKEEKERLQKEQAKETKAEECARAMNNGQPMMASNNNPPPQDYSSKPDVTMMEQKTAMNNGQPMMASNNNPPPQDYVTMMEQKTVPLSN